MPAIPIIAAVVGAGAGMYGAKKQSDRMRSMMSPESGRDFARRTDPNMFYALQGINKGGSGYSEDVYNMARDPGYIDPAVRNQPFQLSHQRQQSDFNRASEILGKTSMGATSGIGNAYVLANQAARASRDVNTQQQYTLWRENQRTG